MSGAKHTPGPWVVESNGYYPVVCKRFRPDHFMQVCGPVQGYMYSADEKAEQTANARLIAAAPDMAEAARLLLEANDRVVEAMASATSEADAQRIAQEGSEAFNATLPALRAALAKAGVTS